MQIYFAIATRTQSKSIEAKSNLSVFFTVADEQISEREKKSILKSKLIDKMTNDLGYFRLSFYARESALSFAHVKSNYFRLINHLAHIRLVRRPNKYENFKSTAKISVIFPVL